MRFSTQPETPIWEALKVENPGSYAIFGRMAHDIFISYSSKDKPVADAVCNKLESEKIRCWIAPRDIVPGKDWGEAIIDGIENSKVMLLVFSSHANESVQIKREVERAVNKGVPIVPVRIENVAPTKSLEYFISTPHWLDAITPPIERHLDYVVGTVRVLMERDTKSAVFKALQTPPPPPPVTWRNWWQHPLCKNKKFVRTALAAVAVLMLILFLTASAIDSALIGTWQTVNEGAGITITQTNQADGDFKATAVLEEKGRIEIRSGSLVYLIPTQQVERLISWEPVDDVTVKTSSLIPNSYWGYLSFTAFQPSSIDFGDINYAATQGVWKRTTAGPGARYPITSDVQLWEYSPKIGSQVWKLTFEVHPDSNYIFRGSYTDVGKLQAKSGKWSTVSANGLVRSGDYQIIDSNTISVIGVTGPVIWTRVD